MNNQKTKEELQLEEFLKFQDECVHHGNFSSVNQIQIPDGVSRKLILVNTIMCNNCGKQFQQSIQTGISIGTIQQNIPFQR